MENKKMFIVSKEKAREIIDSDRCTNCGKYGLEFGYFSEDANEKRLIIRCQRCGHTMIMS